MVECRFLTMISLWSTCTMSVSSHTLSTVISSPRITTPAVAEVADVYARRLSRISGPKLAS